MVPELRVLYINPAPGCNLRCRHCWVEEGQTVNSTLSIEQWEDILEQGKELGCRSVKFTGGEPLLYDDFVPLYEFAAERFTTSIETNGTIVPNRLWEALARNRPSQVSVSLDSANAETHDRFRGSGGAWRKTVSFLEKLAEHRIPSQVVMSVSDTDRISVSDLIQLLEEKGLKNLKINFVLPMGRASESAFLNGESPESVLGFFRWLSDETPHWVRPHIPAAFRPVKSFSIRSCCPVLNLMGVLPDGTFSLCGVAFSRKELAWGRYPDQSVHEAWENSPVLQRLRTDVPGNLQGICSRCIHRNSCIGDCVASNYVTGGELSSAHMICQSIYDAGLFPETRLWKGK